LEAQYGEVILFCVVLDATWALSSLPTTEKFIKEQDMTEYIVYGSIAVVVMIVLNYIHNTTTKKQALAAIATVKQDIIKILPTAAKASVVSAIQSTPVQRVEIVVKVQSDDVSKA
jgi:hypothetical protein